MKICKGVCICPNTNAKIRRSTDSVDLLNAMYDQCHESNMYANNPIITCKLYMCAHSFVQVQHPYANSSISIHKRKENAHTSICYMRVIETIQCLMFVYMHPHAATIKHLHPSNITCLKHMFTSIGFLSKGRKILWIRYTQVIETSADKTLKKELRTYPRKGKGTKHESCLRSPKSHPLGYLPVEPLAT